MHRRRVIQAIAYAAASALPLARAWGRGAYPDHPIKLIVPRPAGGVVDIITRAWGDKVAQTLGTTFIENMGGGGGIIGAVAAARSPADGYTLLLGTTSELVINPILQKVRYDPIGSFEPIAILCDSPACFIVNPAVPAKTLKELVQHAQRNPGAMNYGSAGAGTVSNLAGEQFKRLADLPDMTHIPYKGGGPAVADTIGGQVPVSTPMMSQQIYDLHKAGKVRIVAVASQARLAGMPDIPTAVEQGFPDLVARLFVGLFAPEGTPKDVVAKIETATQAALKDPALRDAFEANGFETLASADTASSAAYVRAEIARWKPVLVKFATKE